VRAPRFLKIIFGLRAAIKIGGKSREDFLQNPVSHTNSLQEGHEF